MTGFISPTSLTRSNRREITIFVNGRPVQDASLVTALVQGYHTLLMVGRYPLAILFIEMPPDAVDVNVHPTKAEVRFRAADRVFSAVQRSVRRALLAHTPVPEVEAGLGQQLYRASAPGTQPNRARSILPGKSLIHPPFFPRPLFSPDLRHLRSLTPQLLRPHPPSRRPDCLDLPGG